MSCPMIDHGHPECEANMRVDRLVHVLSVCAHEGFDQCPILKRCRERNLYIAVPCETRPLQRCA